MRPEFGILYTEPAPRPHVTRTAPPPLHYDPPASPLAILHSDAQLLIVDKPAGLLSVPGRDPGHRDCVLSRLQAEDPAALLIHRLDLDTSGVMVFARTKAAQRHLGLQFERRHVSKSYTARVNGHPGASGRVAAPLRADWPNRPLQMVCEREGRPALTDWVRLAQEGPACRLRLTPITGRSHQLRVHMAHIGHPILGDRFYGDPGSAERLMLHATSLTVRHPDGGAPVTFDSPCPF